MQIQKHLFRIAERALKSPNSSLYWRVICLGSLFLCTYFITIFIYGTYYIHSSNTLLSQCLKKSSQLSQFKLESDSIYIVLSKQLSQLKLKQIKQNNQTATQNDACMIIKNLNIENYNQRPFQFTWTQNLLYFDSQERVTYKFTNYTIALKNIPTLKYFIFGMNTLLANQLVYNPLGVFAQNAFIKSSSVVINTNLPIQLTVFGKLERVIKSMIYYIIISIVTSLYIYGTIIAAPAVIIIFLRCSQFARNGGNMGDVYKIFPWIGMHSLIRQTSDSQEIKASSREVCSAIILYFFFLYFVYYAIVLQISTDIFYQKTEQGLQQILFGYIALVQFCAIVFMRTRPFLKYFPAMHTLLLFIAICYSQFVSFGLKKNALMIACTASATLFALMIIQLEIPGQNTWNRTKKHTPTADRPRIGFLPLFNMSWINNLPDEWTLLFPLFGRQNFTQRQLAFADRNFQQLDQVFNANGQAGHQ